MDQFKKEDFENLSKARNTFCVSIYLPTHTAGAEVNKSMDRISFKNKVQVVKEQLEALGHKSITNFLAPAYGLIDDISFWKEQANGLAVFMTSDMFKVYRLPITFPDLSLVGNSFELTHLLPLLTTDDTFYTLLLSLKGVRFFTNNSFGYQELDVSGYMPHGLEEILEYYEFNKDYQVKQPHIGGQRGPNGPSHFKSNEGVNGGAPQDKSYKYVEEYLHDVDKGIMQLLNESDKPLIVAAVDNIYGEYRKMTHYKFVEENAIFGNPDAITDREIYEKALKIAQPVLDKGKRRAIEKYGAWAGTGKTSYDLETILNAAIDGRIETLFLLEGMHAWGSYNTELRKAVVHDIYQLGDDCLYSLAAGKTVENNGKAYVLKQEDMPEKTVSTSIAATFRY